VFVVVAVVMGEGHIGGRALSRDSMVGAYFGLLVSLLRVAFTEWEMKEDNNGERPWERQSKKLHSWS
jgi:hypothetical protein